MTDAVNPKHSAKRLFLSSTCQHKSELSLYVFNFTMLIFFFFLTVRPNTAHIYFFLGNLVYKSTKCTVSHASDCVQHTVRLIEVYGRRQSCLCQSLNVSLLSLFRNCIIAQTPMSIIKDNH